MKLLVGLADSMDKLALSDCLVALEEYVNEAIWHVYYLSHTLAFAVLTLPVFTLVNSFREPIPLR